MDNPNTPEKVILVIYESECSELPDFYDTDSYYLDLMDKIAKHPKCPIHILKNYYINKIETLNRKILTQTADISNIMSDLNFLTMKVMS